MSRMRNCIGTLRNALNSSESRLWVRLLPDRYRCTWLWSHPKYDSMRKSPPISPLQMV